MFSVVSPILLLAGPLLDSYSTFRAIGWILGLGMLSLSVILPVASIWRTVVASVAAGAFAMLSGGSLVNSFLGGFGGSNVLEFLLAFGSAIYALICAVWYSRRPTFTLAISSKGGSSTPINISGATGLGILDAAAGRALTAEPAGEAEVMLKELGAVIMDIQMMGDIGINKWRVN